MIRFKFGIPEIAVRNLELYTGAVLAATLHPYPAPQQDWREQMESMSSLLMNLLVAQIQNQDPLSPMDNAEFTSQITQFTMLDEMQSMNAKLEDNLMVGQTINNTAMLIEIARKTGDYLPDLSFGTHFFQDLVEAPQHESTWKVARHVPATIEDL